MRGFETILLLVTLATVVAVSARRLRLPAPSLLVLAGVAVGVLPWVPAVQIGPEFVSLVVLPPLLYAAGEDLSWRDLRAVWRPVAVLALGLVVATAAAVGAVAAAVTPLSGTTAFLLGAILASTDPVAVTALGRRLPLPARVQALIQAESLFNDATSLVLFRVAAAAVVAGGTVSPLGGAGQFVLMAGGGVGIGALVAAGVALVRRRTEDPILETVIALITPYAAYVAAEAVHVSGVTAVVVASVILGGLSPRLTNPDIRLQLHAVYGTVVFLLESVVFSLIGLALPGLVSDLEGSVAALPWQVLVIAGTLLAVRALWVFPLSAAVQRRTGAAFSWRVPAVVSWAGARGVLPLAAALSIPLTTDHGDPLPHRELVLTLTAAIIVVTLIVQGLTLGPLVRATGVAVDPGHARDEDTTARLRMARAALGRLDELDDLEAVPQSVSHRLHRSLQARIEQDRGEAGADDGTESTYRQVRQDLIAVEANELRRLYETGVIGEGTRRRLQRTLDLEHASLTEDHH